MNKQKISFFCPVCSSPMSSNVSIEAYKICGACDLCETYIYYINKQKWDLGWRPTQKEAREYLKNKGIKIIVNN
jgi:hypothetical protein